MKKIILLATFVLALVACEKEVKFNGEQQESRLVLYCNAVAGEKLIADVSVSVFFLDRQNGNNDFTDPLDRDKGSVKVYVNGSDIPYEMVYSPREPRYYYFDPADPGNSKAYPPETLCYSCDYVPQEGDHIRVVASFPGYDEVTGETDVPKSNFHIVDYSRTAADQYGTLCYDVIASVDDPGNAPLCYAVFPYARQFFYEDEKLQFENNSIFDITSSDVVFTDAASQLESLIAGEDDTSHYFSNEIIYGRKHEFKFRFYVTSYYAEDFEYENSRQTSKLYVDLHTFSQSYYYHMSSMEKVHNSTFGLFGEGVTLYSNVKGGYGTVCASVTNSISLPLK